MTTLLTPETTEAGAEEPTPGCGCCVPPPDTVDTRVAELLARRQRLERKLASLPTGSVASV
ncbi:MAG TPA: hypothetical protein VHF27_10295 [Acidimicrobiales bacterium]|nr:hypothetical protein [Acidimicrobiales bacterium]